MSDIYVVHINNEDITMEVSETSFGTVVVTDTATAMITVEGGVPGPQGNPGVDADDLMVLHLIDPTPHPVYDDMPSLVIIFENGIV